MARRLALAALVLLVAAAAAAGVLVAQRRELAERALLSALASRGFASPVSRFAGRVFVAGSAS